MTETLICTGLSGGRYEGLLTGAGATEIEALYRGRIVAVARIAPPQDGQDAQRVTLDLPAEVLSDGVQVVGLRSTVSGEILDRITLMAGNALDGNVLAELTLLRDELEMLKRAFRRHCIETAQE